MSARKITLSICAIVLLTMLCSVVFTITEGQHALLLRFGHVVVDEKTQQVNLLKPGLHFKMPFIESVQRFDTRVQTVSIKLPSIATKDNEALDVDYYVKWRIVDLPKYYLSTDGDDFKIKALMKQQIDPVFRKEIHQRLGAEIAAAMEALTPKHYQKAKEQASQFGIDIIDVRIKKIGLPSSTSNVVFQNMRAKALEVANGHRAEGGAVAEAIKASADAKVTIVLAKAHRDAQEIRGRGQAEAAKIYANAFNKNPGFFVFYRSLKAYEHSFHNKQSIFVLDQSNSFFEYFKHAFPKKTE